MKKILFVPLPVLRKIGKIILIIAGILAFMYLIGLVQDPYIK